MNYLGMNVFVYNEYWEYQRTINIVNTGYISNSPSYALNVNGTIYMQHNAAINKYDKYLNFTKQVSSPGFNRGIYYNSTNQMIYSVVNNLKVINIYDKDLVFNRNISTNYNPWFIAQYNGNMVVTDNDGGKIYFYEGDSVNRTVVTNCTGRINWLLFDNYNQMLVLCQTSSIFIYNVDGTNTGVQVTACSGLNRWFVNFDSKDRLAITCDDRVEIFY
jgi:hypothetical protein